MLCATEKWGLGIIVLVAAAARGFHIGSDSLWLDEAASWWFSAQPWGELWGTLSRHEPNPPLYYSLLKVWAALFGNSETALRSMSAVASLLTVILVYFIGRAAAERRADGIWIGMVAAACIALHPIQIRYAQEARAYAMLTLAATVLLLSMLWLLRHPQVLSAPPHQLVRMAGSRGRWTLSLFVFGAALAFWMHNTAVLLVGCVIGVFAICAITGSNRRVHTTLNLAILGGAILLLWLPGLYLLLGSLGKVDFSFWIGPPNLGGLIYVADFLFGSLENAVTSEMRLLAVVVVGLVAIGGGVALVLRGQWTVLRLLAVAALLPFLASLLASIFVTPIFIPRTLIWTAIPFVVLVSSAVLLFKSNVSRGLFAAGLFVACGVMTVGSFTGALRAASKESWRDIVRLLEEKTARDDAVALWPGMLEHALLYYRADQRVAGEIVKLSPACSAGPERLAGTEDLRARLQELERSHNVIWFVAKRSSDPGFIEARAVLEAARGASETHYVFDDTFYVWSYPRQK